MDRHDQSGGGAVIEGGQVYVQVKSDYYTGERRRIVVLRAPGLSDRRKALVATLTENGRRIRARWINVAELHEDILTRHGHPRRNGYALEVKP